MKKQTIFMIALGFILMIAGGVGSLFYYQQLETQRQNNDVHEKFKYDNSEELEITIKNGASLHLSTSDDDYVHMNKQGVSYNKNDKNSASWTVEKNGKKTFVKIDNKSSVTQNGPNFFNFGNIYDDNISLSFPSNYKKIVVKGKNLDVNAYDLTLTNLSVESGSGSIYASGLVSDELSIESKHGDIRLQEGKIAKDVAITSTNGNVSVEDTSFTNLKAKLTNGDIVTGNTRGDINITNQSGYTSVNHQRGQTDIESTNGDIMFHGNDVNHDVALQTVHGDIQFEIDEDSYDNNKFDLSTQYGIVSIFNKNLSSDTTYKSNKGKSTIKASSKNGDISVDQIDDDDTEYHDY